MLILIPLKLFKVIQNAMINFILIKMIIILIDKNNQKIIQKLFLKGLIFIFWVFQKLFYK